MNDDLVAGRIKLLADDAFISGVLIVVPAMFNDVGDYDSRTHHASRFLLRAVRLQAFQHFLVSGEDSRANRADVFVVLRSRNQRLFQQFANEFVSSEGRLIVERLAAWLARKQIPVPTFLQTFAQLCVVDYKVSFHFELTDKRLAAYLAEVILLDGFLWLFHIFVDGFLVASH